MNVIVLMTALLPTRGHADLIEFAAGLPGARVWVLLNGRTHEPFPSETRLAAVSEVFNANPHVTVRLSLNDEAPQNPGDHPAFWAWWRAEINRNFPEVKEEWTYVVASEPYGAQVAHSLGARFMPYDPYRELNPIRSTDARKDPWGEWAQLLPLVRRELTLKATLFGQESVGKTTVSKLVAEKLDATWLFEWARPYLETVGPEVTLQAMAEIHAGQASVQAKAFREAATPAIVLDTDLFTTAGYYPIMGEAIPPAILRDAHRLASDVYYLMGDDIPFEADPLRYGGDRRESSWAYWRELLERESLPYVTVPPGQAMEKADFIARDLLTRFNERVASLAAFERE